MEYITTVHLNAVSPEREEEFNNWYTFVHFRDVLNMPGHIAAQRFCRSEYQPAVYDETYKYYTFYELRSKQRSTLSHQERVMSWQMYISSAMDLSNYKESYWDHVCGNVPYASYASHGHDQSVLVALIAPKDGVKVESVFTEEAVLKLAEMDGVLAANLYRFGTDQMPKQSAAPEPNTHQLVLQLADARRGCASWDAFIAELPGYDGVIAAVCNYTAVMPRITEAWPTYQDRAIAALSHLVVSLPGFYAGQGYSKCTDILSPGIKKGLEALNAKES